MLIERATIALDRIREGRHARSFVFYGLRGVGKTVLLNRVRLDAKQRGFVVMAIETPEGRSLAEILAPSLRAVLIDLDRREARAEKVKQAKGVLAAFLRALKVKHGDLEFGGLDVAPALGIADSGDLERDLSELFEAVGGAAKVQGTAVVLFIDEIQYIRQADLAALMTALHAASQSGLPICLVGAGLPQLLALSGKARSYAERLIEFVEIGSLDNEAATQAIVRPAIKEDANFDDESVREIIKQTEGYPYFLQEWGKHVWDVAERSPITLQDVHAATALALNELDTSFFRVRFDRLTPKERQYLYAMADLGPGPHRSGNIAKKLKREVTTFGTTRQHLIEKGMIYSPAHGDTAFTVPLFDGFLKRTKKADRP